MIKREPVEVKQSHILVIIMTSGSIRSTSSSGGRRSGSSGRGRLTIATAAVVLTVVAR